VHEAAAVRFAREIVRDPVLDHVHVEQPDRDLARRSSSAIRSIVIGQRLADPRRRHPPVALHEHEAPMKAGLRETAIERVCVRRDALRAARIADREDRRQASRRVAGERDSAPLSRRAGVPIFRIAAGIEREETRRSPSARFDFVISKRSTTHRSSSRP
jgi:hypothetical protein